MSRKARSRCRRRQGSTYVAVMVASMIVMVIGLGSLLARRAQLRATLATASIESARRNARSAVDLALLWMTRDPAWRTSRASGTWVERQPLGEGFYSVEVVDPSDHDLADDDTESVVITGTGLCGDARQSLRVMATHEVREYGCLEAALHAGGDLEMDDATVFCNQTISSNDDIRAEGQCSIRGNVEAVGSIDGDEYEHSTTSDVDYRTMPDSDVFSLYALRGTSIAVAGLPLVGGARTMENILLSPASNPFGPTSPIGMYVLNCGGQVFRLRNVRVVGTLIVLQPGPGSRIEQSVHIEPAAPVEPSLLIDGSIAIALSDADVAETVAGTSLNPPGTPYEGSADTDTADAYPSRIAGLVYVSGDLAISGRTVCRDTVVVGGEVSVTGVLSIGRRATYLESPPPGFSSTVGMTMREGSWVRVVDADLP